MDKIKLTDNAKRILWTLYNKEELNITDADENDLIVLDQEGLVNPEWTTDGPFPDITDKGTAYVYMNPKLKNPSIWDDYKYWVTTSIAIAALILSLISIIVK